MSITILLLAVNVSCAAEDSQSPVPPTATITEQLIASATPLPTATAEAPAPTDTVEAPIPAGWMTHTNQRCQYAISYPAEMQVTDQGTTSQLFAFDLDTPGAGPNNFIYVSLIDQNSPATSAGIIYNYDPVETEILLNMQIGESKPSRDFAGVAEFFTYERGPDTSIDGHDAQTYENAQPWEFPVGTKEIRYYLSLNGCTYLIGGYLDAMGSSQAGAISEELFNQIIATVQFP
jgi:hypothetical protein